MKRILTMLAVALMLGTSSASFAGHDHHATKPSSVKTVSAVCPVMKTKIPDIKKAAGKSVYKGKTYYFCCAGCKPKFDKNPAKYINPKNK